jgi:hypothetical protein
VAGPEGGRRWRDRRGGRAGDWASAIPAKAIAATGTSATKAARNVLIPFI